MTFKRASSIVPAALLLATLAGVTSSEATRIRQLNIQEMTQRASRVFEGRCTDVRVERDPSLGLDVTVVTFEVSRAAKGRPDRHVVIRFLGGGQGVAIPGGPAFAPGEEVVLFLYGESRRGLTSPVGLGQGKFTVVTDKRGRRVALNEFANRKLFMGLDQRAARHLASPTLREQGTQPISPESLLDLVEALDDEQR